MIKHTLTSILFIITIASPSFASSEGTASNQSLPAPQVTISKDGATRVIRANGIPNHAVGQFPNPGNPNTISPQNYTFRMPLYPTTNAAFTPIRMQAIGVAINGVPFDPGTAEFWNHDRTSGWHIEAFIGSRKTLGLDQNNAHVQPNGAYHYHGIPTGLVAALGGGREKMTLLGYAADGFPIYGPLAYDKAHDPSSSLRTMKPSWQLKRGGRPGGNGPGGTYDGTYTQDFEFLDGSGDLDEANGRVGITPEYPQGTYYYVATETFPFYPRLMKGNADPSFQRGPLSPGGKMNHFGPPPTGMGGGGSPEFFQEAGDRPGPPPAQP